MLSLALLLSKAGRLSGAGESIDCGFFHQLLGNNGDLQYFGGVSRYEILKVMWPPRALPKSTLRIQYGAKNSKQVNRPLYL
ncbi:hypothetical protein [Vreelandella alkaliphila]|uniref:Uncharacterized protein n=1 Tax=Vreelandella alkaliphila TaxID=272774 RepID=A0ABX4HPN0_9GAMM|nr:hypothetical protein [Halomonas humidisoli]PAU73836.1 hypothetical protein CK497_04325 [Halomonas humidisoli]